MPDIKAHILANWKIKGNVSMSSNWDGRHVVFMLDSEEDVNAALVCPSRKVHHAFYRLFRWSTEYNPKKESTRVTKWIKLPGLPMEFFTKSSVKAIVSSFAYFLDIDERTYSMNSLQSARACVELDVAASIPAKVWIAVGDHSFYQDIVVEGGIAYCNKCKIHGHDVATCKKMNKTPTQMLHTEETANKPTTQTDQEGWQHQKRKHGRIASRGIKISSQGMIQMQESIENMTIQALIHSDGPPKEISTVTASKLEATGEVDTEKGARCRSTLVPDEEGTLVPCEKIVGMPVPVAAEGTPVPYESSKGTRVPGEGSEGTHVPTDSSKGTLVPHVNSEGTLVPGGGKVDTHTTTDSTKGTPVPYVNTEDTPVPGEGRKGTTVPTESSKGVESAKLVEEGCQGKQASNILIPKQHLQMEFDQPKSLLHGKRSDFKVAKGEMIAKGTGTKSTKTNTSGQTGQATGDGKNPTVPNV